MLEAGCVFDVAKVDLQDKPQWFKDMYAQANPIAAAAAKVPLLEVPSATASSSSSPPPPLVLCESLVIVDYVAESFGAGAILPSTPSDRATARLFVELCGGAFG